MSLDDVLRNAGALVRGMTGDAVRQVQQLLVEHRYVLAADGEFGAPTEAAVCSFQHRVGLAQTGRVDRDTLVRLQGEQNELPDGMDTDRIAAPPSAPNEEGRLHKPQDTMRPAELERSRGSARNGTAVVRSCDEQDVPSAFQAQYAAVKRAYASARVVCLASAGNGDRPVFALVNRDFDPSQPFNVQTHYHGIGSSVQQGPHSARVKELLSNAPPAAQTLVVLPESGDMSTVERWNNVTSQAQTTQDAEEAVRRALGSPTTWNVAQRVVSLHSAGGDVLRLSATKRPPSLRADRIELLDCLYDNGALTRAGCPKVTDALTAIAKAYPDATFVYRRFENSEKELAADGAMKLRGEIVQDRVGSDRFAIVDRAAPGGPRSHEDAARFLGVQ